MMLGYLNLDWSHDVNNKEVSELGGKGTNIKMSLLQAVEGP
jgi:hypothetical protein